MASEWRIYYSDGSYIEGESRDEWLSAPDNGVQVVVLMEPPQTPHRTYKKHGANVVVTDRQLWDGVDEYDPFGWGIKHGQLLDDAAFFAIWEAACGDN